MPNLYSHFDYFRKISQKIFNSYFWNTLDSKPLLPIWEYYHIADLTSSFSQNHISYALFKKYQEILHNYPQYNLCFTNDWKLKINPFPLNHYAITTQLHRHSRCSETSWYKPHPLLNIKLIKAINTTNQS